MDEGSGVAERTSMRIGHGYDVHRFGAGDEIVLGGVHIPHHRGLEAHSDGDVLIHAVCDALLGAAGKGDIGRHFPDTDPANANIDSRLLLRRVVAGHWGRMPKVAQLALPRTVCACSATGARRATAAPGPKKSAS